MLATPGKYRNLFQVDYMKTNFIKKKIKHTHYYTNLQNIQVITINYITIAYHLSIKSKNLQAKLWEIFFLTDVKNLKLKHDII